MDIKGELKKIDHTLHLIEKANCFKLYEEQKNLYVSLANRIKFLVQYCSIGKEKTQKNQGDGVFDDQYMQDMYNNIAIKVQSVGSVTLDNEEHFHILDDTKQFVKILKIYLSAMCLQMNDRGPFACTVSTNKRNPTVLAIAFVVLLAMSVAVSLGWTLVSAIVKPVVKDYYVSYKQKYINIDVVGDAQNESDSFFRTVGFFPLEYHGEAGSPFRWLVGPKAFIYFKSSVDDFATLKFQFIRPIDDQSVQFVINGKEYSGCGSLNNLSTDNKTCSGIINFKRANGINVIEIDVSKWNTYENFHFSEDPRPLALTATELRIFAGEPTSYEPK